MNTIQKLSLASRLLGVALVYTLLAQLALNFFSPVGIIGVFWPAGGWALASLLLGGRRMAWGIFAGALVYEFLLGRALPAALITAGGATASALLGHGLLQRDAKFSTRLQNIGDFTRLVIWAAIPAGVFSALVGVGSLTLTGSLAADDFGRNMVQWVTGDALGVLLITSLILIWRQAPEQLKDRRRWIEAALILGLTLLMGRIVLQGWLSEELAGFVPKGYWLLPVAFWAATRLGPHGAIVILCIMAVQTMHSIHDNRGFLAHPEVQTRLLDGWFFVTLSWLMIMFLALRIKAYRNAETDLRIAATAFECQEGMIITDARLRILRTNQSFTRIMGYGNDEVVGQPTTFMRSDRQPASFYENAWRTAQEQGVWSDEVWHRRKNGEVFPQWLTATAVKDANGEITNYVVTHTDISYRKRQEAEQQAAQLAQRDALVREVHHRIKNNLQGITGLLRQFAQSHPETADPINQAIGQVRSIAVIHGLQGRDTRRTVRLCELTGAIASDIEALWQVPVRVDLPACWTPCVVAETEAVPLALVLNELIINAVKHGRQKTDGVDVRLRKGDQADHIHIRISNTGDWLLPQPGKGPIRSGLQLIEAMLPRSGAQLLREQDNGMIHVSLTLTPPVIHLESPPTHHESVPDRQNATAAG